MTLGFTTKSFDFTSAVSINPDALIAKGHLENLDTLEIYTFMFNPASLTKSIKPVYAKKNIQYRSHNRFQYKYTESSVWKFQLYLNSISSGNQGVVNLLSVSENLNNHTNYLESLCYPLVIDGRPLNRPPFVNFVWPHLANIRCICLGVEVNHQAFNARLQQKVTTVDVELAENPVVSRTSNEVLTNGSFDQPNIDGATGLIDLIPGSSALKKLGSII